MSNISSSTNKIDVLFPIAGQDNPSQGFRDNFANIKSALTVAAGEVGFLQTDAVLKSTAINNMEGNNISNVVLGNSGLLATANVAVGNLIQDVPFVNGSYQEFSITTNVTFNISFADKPANVLCSTRLLIHGLTSNQISFIGPVSTVMHSDTALPHQLNGDDTVVWDVWTSDGSQNIYITKVGAVFASI